LSADGSVVAFDSAATNLAVDDAIADTEVFAFQIRAMTPPPPPPTAPVVFTAMSPGRLLDTRADGATVDGQFRNLGVQPPGRRLMVRIAGRGGVPASATAAALNVTVTGATGAGFVTAWPCDTVDPPNASSLNFTAGLDVANAVVVPLSAAGDVCLQASNAGAHLIADANGFFPAGSAYRPLSPRRVLDTRTDGATFDGQFRGAGVQQPGRRLELQVGGRGAPVGAAAVSLNVTVTGGTGGGFVTVWPCDTVAPPNASSLNFAASQDIPNAVVAPMSPAGVVCLQTSNAGAHLLADLNGFFAAGSAYRPLSPQRLLDTRADGATVDGQARGLGLQVPGRRLELQVGGRGGVTGAAAVALNVTVTGSTGSGFVTVWPCDTADPPNASSLNFDAGHDVPNLVISALSSTGTVCLQASNASAHLIADVNGYIQVVS
jgi:hypothetical protein